jgi:hypothetical protein
MITAEAACRWRFRRVASLLGARQGTRAAVTSTTVVHMLSTPCGRNNPKKDDSSILMVESLIELTCPCGFRAAAVAVAVADEPRGGVDPWTPFARSKVKYES